MKKRLPPRRTISRQSRAMTACLLFRGEAEAVEIGALVLPEGLAVGGIAEAHRHLVDAIAAQRALAVEERRVGNAISVARPSWCSSSGRS